MKKTLVLTHEYYPFFGGVARYCFDLFKHFDKQDYLVLCDHPEVKTQDNVWHFQFKNKFIKPTWLFSFFKLYKIIKTEKIEQIFTPNILPLGSICYYLYKFFKLPYIISLHGLDINLALKNKKNLALKILQHANYIICNSQSTANIIANLSIDQNKIKVIYPGLDFNPDVDQDKLLNLKKALNLNAGQKVILTTGRLNKRKGHDLIIQALHEIEQNFVYFIIGRGEEDLNLRKLVEKYKMEAKVRFLNNISDEELPYYYRLADLFILANREGKEDVEGFGIVFLNAASCGLPIIAGASGGVLEIFTDQKNALLVDSENVEQLKEKINLLLTDQDLAKDLARAAYARSQEFLSSKQQSEKLKRYL